MAEHSNDWTAGGSAGGAEVLDFGTWIDGEMFSEKDDTEGPTHDADA
ncbi:hypothetical protein [Kocuria sp.]|nr:hypothetical protein [Kocuria sp.]MDO4920104.1 hypothetical protein [Kocuria sp.]